MKKSPDLFLQKQVPMGASVLVCHLGLRLCFWNLFPCCPHFNRLGFHQRAVLDRLHKMDYFWRKLNQKIGSRGTVKAVQPLQGIQPLGPGKLVWSKPPETDTGQMLGYSAPIILCRHVAWPKLPPQVRDISLQRDILSKLCIYHLLIIRK